MDPAKPTFPDSLIPANDAVRLRTLHQYQIVNTTPEQIFDEYAAWAAQLFAVPIALISLVDAEQVVFKARVGTGNIATLPRADSMCSAAILYPDTVVFSDYTKESCGLISETVAQAVGLKFYAGSALQMSDGAKIGMLAVIGREPRVFTATETSLLVTLARLVSLTIELRGHYLTQQQPEEWEETQQELSKSLDDNTALARYLASRPQGIDLTDQEIVLVLYRRLENTEAVLRRRLAQKA